MRDGLYEAEGIAFTDDCIVVPVSLRQYMLDLIHESHLGIEKSKTRARELLYWSRMNLDIEETVANCDICNMYQRAHQREPMIPHEIPAERFLKTGLDIMSLHNKDILLLLITTPNIQKCFLCRTRQPRP